MADLPSIPVVDVREGGTLRHAREGSVRARGLRDTCVAWFPAMLGRWCRCSTASPGAG